MATTPTSGAISIAQLASVGGVSSTGYNLWSNSAKMLARKSAIPISMADFYNKSTPLVKTLNPLGLSAAFTLTSPASLGWYDTFIRIKATGELTSDRYGYGSSTALTSQWGTYHSPEVSDQYAVAVSWTAPTAGGVAELFYDGAFVGPGTYDLSKDISFKLHRDSGNPVSTVSLVFTEKYTGLSFSTAITISYAG